jgi:hypothetical protein
VSLAVVIALDDPPCPILDVGVGQDLAAADGADGAPDHPREQ